ncbi:MAG: hypothetical protein ABUT20_14200 [Bacteroidota bacterium]
MKIFSTTVLLALSFSLFAQDIIGRYRDYFGSRIELKADGNFKYTWHFDLSASWTKGTWILNNDTVYFYMTPTYDTIIYKNNDGTSTDKLILSVDEIPERLTLEQNISRGLSSGGQNFQSCPDKLFFRKKRLYKIYKGQLVVKKQKGIWTNKKWNPWYFKSSE